ncbi:D-tyrosyl-tRNA(Tyr) deacylase [Peltigera leucophlebia]|nr:D-tyrosyl-tRNA(Tyr) deacylase [Peltigera leucophlebia]
MKAILQRVASASVTVDTHLVSSIGKGVLVFAAVAPDDTLSEVESMASKVLKLRMWPDEAGGTWKRSVVDIAGEVLCVSQFTLLAQTKKGSKPDFHGAAGGDKARELYNLFVDKVKEIYQHEKVKNGVFQAMMQVELVNDGPVGVDYRCDDGEVTLEIQTNPPKKAEAKPDPSKDEKEEASKGFEMPAELLE